VIAIIAVLVVAFAIKTFYFSSPVAEASASAASVNVLQLQADYPNIQALPVQYVKQPVELN
jgi:hypothetical protein